ncbi:MAG: Indolepyruvate oxidoreductase subunit IorB [Firmicutes bacterium]|nr:Indolepyruvate oxidoreductase subunit IorB [Bacillota bacterium]
MMAKEIKNILMVGVGGQGTILASKVLSNGLVNAGYDVKMSEVHGMAQRGGSVTTQVRYGEKVYSPIIGKGQADIIVAFERMEALRMIQYLKKGGVLVVNDHVIPPMTVLTGAEEYPEGIIEELSSKAKTIVFKAAEVAREIGNPKTQNIVLLGALIKAIGLEDLDWDTAIEAEVKPQFVAINKKALQKGMELAS